MKKSDTRISQPHQGFGTMQEPNSQQWQPLAASGAMRLRRGLRLGLFCVAIVAVVALGLFILQYRTAPRLGQVSETLWGEVVIQDNVLGPLIEATPGRIVRPGARLYGSQGAVATITFFDDSAFRIESDGTWYIAEISGSRNNRLSRIDIRQVQGRASYVSRPPQPGVDSRFQVLFEGAGLSLVGVAQATVLDGSVEVTVLQGTAILKVADGSAQVTLEAGRSAKYALGSWQPL